MSKTKDTFVIEKGTKKEIIDKVLSGTEPLTEQDFPLIGEETLRLLMAQVKGEVNIPASDIIILQKIFAKLVSDAPKRVEIQHSIKPGEYIAQAMEQNEASYLKLQAHARKQAEEVEAINAEFYTIIDERL